MTNIKNQYMILGYNNRQTVAKAAILNTAHIFSAWIFGDFSPGCYVGIKVTFLKNSAFYIFSRLNPNAPGLYYVQKGK